MANKPDYVPPAPKAETPPAPPAAPVAEGLTQADLDTRLAERDRQIERERAEFKAQISSTEAQMNQLQGIMAARFTNKIQPPGEAGPVATAEDFLTPESALRAADRLAEDKVRQAVTTLDANYAGTMKQMLEDQFDSKLETIKTREFYSYIKDDIEDAIRKNPKIRMAPRALDILYNTYVGARGTEIVEAERQKTIKANTESHLETPAAPRAPVRRRESIAPNSGPDNPEPDAAQLSDHEEEIRRAFAKYVPSLTPEAWVQRRAEAERMGEIPTMTERGR